MSDFLARIAARSRGAIATVQPRPVSMFEPAGSAVDIAPPSPSPSGEIKETTEARETFNRGPINRSPERAIGVARPTLDRATGSSLQFDSDHNEVSGPSIRLQRRQRPETGEGPVLRSPQARAVAEAGENSSPLPQMANLSPTVSDARTKDNPAMRPRDHVSVPRLSHERDERATTDDIRTIIERHPIVRPQITSSPTTFSAAAAKAPIPSRFQPANELPPSDTEETVVNVTIGRIEVRAITPQTPRRRELPQPPVMSLDEYLKRERGARR